MAQIRVRGRGHAPKRYVECQMKIWSRRPQFGRQKVEYGARFQRVGHAIVRPIETEGFKQTKHLLRWYPAVREQMFTPSTTSRRTSSRSTQWTPMLSGAGGASKCAPAPVSAFVDPWRKQASDLVHAFRTSAGRLEQTDIHSPKPTELVDCRKQRHPSADRSAWPMRRLASLAALPSRHRVIVGFLEYLPPSFTHGPTRESHGVDQS